MPSTDFAARVLEWFEVHGRTDLPWQGKDAYRVWVSEIMLQQTQVKTVIPYFERFVKRFPSISALAEASTDDVLAHWSGLGYYARARNLHRAAQVVHEEHQGRFPNVFDAVVALPGIGRSTAGAILAQAFDQRHPILDGNVKRVLARHAAIAGWPGRAAVARELWTLAERHTPEQRVGDYTQAIMDLGATVCTRSKPACALCPVRSDCQALAVNSVARYPGSKPKRERPLKRTTMLVVVAGNQVYLERRPESGIWGGLWGLPELESDASIDTWAEQVLGQRAFATEPWPVIRHGFTHFDLDIEPIVVRMGVGSRTVDTPRAAAWCTVGGPLPGGIAAPVKNLLLQLELNECPELLTAS